jgi:nucleotide-binding universal stress UspA family protein
MSYRDILVHFDGTPASVLRGRAAAEIASRSKAHLTGVFLTQEMAPMLLDGEPDGLLSPDVFDQILKDHAAALEKASEAARERFEPIAADAGVESEWLKADGATADAMIACARRADLTIFPAAATPYLGRNHMTAAQVGLGCGGPVLVTPEDDYAPPVGKRVLIAWNGKREAARALRDAWPFIERAEELHVLVVSPQGEDGPDGMLQRHLERHGCKANLIIDSNRDESAGEILDRQVAEFDVDLVVMGLYGHSRLQELVFGGVSRHMLRRPSVSVFCSH